MSSAEAKQFDLLITKDDLNHAVNGLVTKEDFGEFKNDFCGTMNIVVNKVDNLVILTNRKFYI